MAKRKPEAEKPEAVKKPTLAIVVEPDFLMALNLYCTANRRKPGEVIQSVIGPMIEGVYLAHRGKETAAPGKL